MRCQTCEKLVQPVKGNPDALRCSWCSAPISQRKQLTHIGRCPANFWRAGASTSWCRCSCEGPRDGDIAAMAKGLREFRHAQQNNPDCEPQCEMQ